MAEPWIVRLFLTLKLQGDILRRVLERALEDGVGYLAHNHTFFLNFTARIMRRVFDPFQFELLW
jgi:hypothetical protein